LNTWLRDATNIDIAPETEGFTDNLEYVGNLPKKITDVGKNNQGGFWDQPYFNKEASW